MRFIVLELVELLIFSVCVCENESSQECIMKSFKRNALNGESTIYHNKRQTNDKQLLCLFIWCLSLVIGKAINTYEFSKRTYQFSVVPLILPTI